MPKEEQERLRLKIAKEKEAKGKAKKEAEGGLERQKKEREEVLLIQRMAPSEEIEEEVKQWEPELVKKEYRYAEGTDIQIPEVEVNKFKGGEVYESLFSTGDEVKEDTTRDFLCRSVRHGVR